MTNDGQKIWNSVLASLKAQFTSSAYRTWFSGSHVLEYKKQGEKTLMIVGVPNNFVKEQLEQRYYKEVEAELKKHDMLVEIVYIISAKKERVAAKNEPILTGNVNNYFGFVKSGGLNPSNVFENFVVGFSNNLAYLAATQVAKEPGKTYNPLLIYGPTGVGKTHLLQAIGNDIARNSDKAKIVYVSAEKFTNEFLESLRNKTQEAFRARYRKADVLLVDDVQFFAGKESTQDEFFFTFNELFISGRQIVCATDRHPREIRQLKERLMSRFVGGMAADVSLPDLEMKMAIVASKCKEKGVQLPSDIVAFIAQSCPGSARELEGALVSVLAQIKLSGGKLGIEELRLAFAQKQKVHPVATPGKIIDAVCKHYKVKSADICGISRKADLVRARQTLMYLLRKELDLPLAQIGQLLGGRDHSTVIHSIEKINKTQQETSKSDEILRIESLIFAAS
jgi:chromosomal replication initiator protein